MGRARTAAEELAALRNEVARLREVAEERDRTECSLRESEQRLAQLVEQCPIAVIEWDTDFRVVEWNAAAERIFGYSRDEMLGEHARRIIPKEARPLVDQIWADLLGQRGGTRSHNDNVTRDGRTITCEWYNGPRVDAGGAVVGVISLAQDVTDRIEAENERKRLERRMLETAKLESLGVLAGGIAHDFNNLLVGISGSWQRRFDGAFRSTSPIYGTAMSPLVEDGRVIAHVGGSGDGALAAFDLATGETIWTWRGDGPGYASPIVADVDGVRQVVTESERHVIGVDFETGSELWKIPLKTPYTQNAVTPVVAGDRLFYSGLDHGLHAVRLSRVSGGWGTEPIWSSRDVSLYMSSPVLADGVLFGLSHLRKGQLFALDVSTGNVVWKSAGRQADNAAILRAGDVWLVLTDAGELEVLERQGARFATLASYQVADTPTWAHPALSGDLILIKARSTLSAWRVR